MKSRILAASLTVLLFAACDKKAETTQNEAPPAERPKAETAAPPKTTVSVPVVEKPAKSNEPPAKVEAPPPPKRLAPAGTLYALERLSMMTDDGVHSVTPGARLTLVRTTATGLLVKSDKAELEVRPEQVTNDLDLAAQAAGHAAQASAAQSTADRARVETAQAKIEQAANANAANMEAGMAAAALKQLQYRQAALQREKTDLQAKLQKDQETAQRREYAKRGLGRDSSAVTVPPSEIAKWRARITQIETDLRDLEARINSGR